MSDLCELYQDAILDHHKKPRNFRALDGVCCHAEGNNPLCGDRITVYLELDGDVVQDIAIQGSGCAIFMAAASMMTESLKGQTRAQAEALGRMFHELVTGATPPAAERDESAPRLGQLAVFAGVRAFPARVKCATLPWHTFDAALAGEAKTVTTE
jgi:nitrogen fixation protein NifU and related proteins